MTRASRDLDIALLISRYCVWGDDWEERDKPTEAVLKRAAD